MLIFGLKQMEIVDRNSDKYGEGKAEEYAKKIKTAINNSNNSQEVKDKQLKEVDNAYKDKNWNVLSNYATMYGLTEIANFFRKMQADLESRFFESKPHAGGVPPSAKAAIALDNEQKRKQIRGTTAKVMAGAQEAKQNEKEGIEKGKAETAAIVSKDKMKKEREETPN